MYTYIRAAILGSAASDYASHMRNNCICQPEMIPKQHAGIQTFNVCLQIV